MCLETVSPSISAVFRDSWPFDSASSKNCAAVLFFFTIGDEEKGGIVAKKTALVTEAYTAKRERERDM